MNDLRFAFRQLLRRPGFTVVAVTTLALGIGANTAIFSLIHSVLLDALPYPRPGELVYVFESLPAGGINEVSGGAFKDWHENGATFARLAVYEEAAVNLTGIGEPERVRCLKASSEYLDVLEVRPRLGRGFEPGDDRVGADNRVVVLAHGFWLSHFGGDPGVLGRTMLLDQMPFTIIGVLPPRALLEDTSVAIVPLVIDQPGENWGRGGHFRRVIGRLKPGATVDQAQADLRGVKQRLNGLYPPFKRDWSVVVLPMKEPYAFRTRPLLAVLLGTVSLVLLIACANVSSLLLARGNARTREMAIRAALGADSWRIVRQLLIESLLLAGLGCMASLLVAQVSIRALRTAVAGLLPDLLQPDLNLPVLGFSIVLAGGCGLLFGVLPAWRTRRPDLNQELKDTDRGCTSPSKRRSQALLVVGEFAFTAILLVGAGLFLRSFVALLRQDPGFDPHQTLAFDLTFPAVRYRTDADRLRFVQELRSRLASEPGIDSVGTINSLPLSRSGLTEFASRADQPPRSGYLVACNYVGGDYFSAMDIRLVRGRLLQAADDRPDAPRVLIIDTGIARDLFPDEDPLGHRLAALGATWEIVGVVRPVRQFGLDGVPLPTLYAPQAFSVPSTSVALRSARPTEALAATVRRVVRDLDPAQPVANVRTLEQAVRDSLAPQRITLSLLGVFAGLAVGLACIGVYGVMSHAVGLRLRELSIRSALGAGRSDIVRLVLRTGLTPALAGVFAGLFAAVLLGRLVERQLFEVRSGDPLVFVASAGVLVLVATAAIYLPARRAARVNPVQVLRHE